jgi:5,10-methylenetetrahydromethanopterin reductase
MTEIWTIATNPTVRDIARNAEFAEGNGFDGLFTSDTQSIHMECWVALTAAACATSSIGLGTGLTNVATRNVAITAAAAATLQEVSGGRVVLGIGRGDSALAHLGCGPVPVTKFGQSIERLQKYLCGESVPFVPEDFPGLPRIDELGFLRVPQESRIEWLPTQQPKVPVNVIASGRRTLRMAALIADEVTPVLGADVALLATTIAGLRQIRAERGLDPALLRISCMPPVGVHNDIEHARQLVWPQLGRIGRWMSTQAGQPETLDDQARIEFAQSVGGYDMTLHGPRDTSATPASTNRLSAPVIDRYAAVGTPEQVIERLAAIAGLGVDRIFLPATAVIVAEILPGLRERLETASFRPAGQGIGAGRHSA